MSEVASLPLGDMPPASHDLKSLRETAGLSIEDMAQRLRISVAQVTAIEAMDFAALPGPPYVQGFLRNYCRIVGTDPAPYLSVVAARGSSGSVNLRDDPRILGRFDDGGGQDSILTTRRMLIATVLVAVVTALFLAWLDRAQWWPMVTGWFGAGGAAQVTAPIVTSDTSSSSSNTPARSAPVPVAAPIAPTSAPVAGLPASAVSSVPVATSVRAAPGERAMRLSFRGDAWVEVLDGAGATISSQLNKAGSELALTGKPPLKITIGSARDVSLAVDGKNYDLSSSVRDNVARVNVP